MRIAAWLLLGAAAQYCWPQYAFGVFELFLAGAFMRWLYIQIKTPTLRYPLYPECNGSCNENQGRGKCTCPHGRPT